MVGPLPVIAGVALAVKIARAAKKVESLRSKMKKVQGKPATTVKKSVDKAMRRSPQKDKKLIKLSNEIKKVSSSIGATPSRVVLNKAAQLQRKTAQGRNIAKKERR